MTTAPVGSAINNAHAYRRPTRPSVRRRRRAWRRYPIGQTRPTPNPASSPGAGPDAGTEAGSEATVAVLVDLAARTVDVAGHRLELTRREFDLLAFLLLHPRRVFTRTQLLDYVWGPTPTGPRTVDVHIRRLRAKLGAPIATTVRGVGYRLGDDLPLRVHPGAVYGSSARAWVVDGEASGWPVSRSERSSNSPSG